MATNSDVAHRFASTNRRNLSGSNFRVESDLLGRTLWTYHSRLAYRHDYPVPELDGLPILSQIFVDPTIADYPGVATRRHWSYTYSALWPDRYTMVQDTTEIEIADLVALHAELGSFCPDTPVSTQWFSSLYNSELFTDFTLVLHPENMKAWSASRYDMDVTYFENAKHGKRVVTLSEKFKSVKRSKELFDVVQRWDPIVLYQYAAAVSEPSYSTIAPFTGFQDIYQGRIVYITPELMLLDCGDGKHPEEAPEAYSMLCCTGTLRVAKKNLSPDGRYFKRLAARSGIKIDLRDGADADRWFLAYNPKDNCVLDRMVSDTELPAGHVFKTNDTRYKMIRDTILLPGLRNVVPEKRSLKNVPFHHRLHRGVR